ncbi:hypothetical protein D9M71_784600 [compost metagenome]
MKSQGHLFFVTLPVQLGEATKQFNAHWLGKSETNTVVLREVSNFVEAVPEI